MPFQQINYDQLRGGENTSVDPRKIDDMQCVLAKNFEFHADQDLRSRTGAKRISVSNPALAFHGTIVSALVDTPVQMAGDGDYVFCIDGAANDALLIIDVSDADKAHIVGAYQNATYMTAPTGVTYDSVNDIVYVASGVYVLAIDVSDKADPTLLDWATNVAVAVNLNCTLVGDYLYTTDWANDAVHSWDVSTPSAIAYGSTLIDATDLDSAAGIAADDTGDYLAVCSYNNDSVTVLDITTPGTCVVHGTMASDTTNLQNPSTIYWDAALEYAIVICNPTVTSSVASITTLNMSNLAAPAVYDTIAISDITGASLNAGQVGVIGGYCYATAINSDRIAIIDISNPDALSDVGNIEGGSIDDNRCLVTLGSSKVITGSQDDSVISVFTILPSVPPSIVDTYDYSASIGFGQAGYLRNNSDGSQTAFMTDGSDDGVYKVEFDAAGNVDSQAFSGANTTYLDNVRACHAYTNNSKNFLVTYAWAVSGDATKQRISIWDITSSFDLTGTPDWNTTQTTGASNQSETMWVGQLSDGKFYLVIGWNTASITSNLNFKVWEIDEVGAGGVPSIGYSILDDGSKDHIPVGEGGRMLKDHNGDYLYYKAYTAAGLPYRIGVLNLTDPTAPGTEAGITPTGFTDFAIHPTNDRLYVVDATFVYTYDCSDPTSLSLLSTVENAETLSGGCAIITENLLVATVPASDALVAFWLNPDKPIVVSNLVDGTNLNLARLQGLLYNESGMGFGPSSRYMICTGDTWTSRFTSVSLIGTQSTELSTELVSQYLSDVRDMMGDSNYLFCIAEDDDALTVLNISDPEEPHRHGDLVDGTNMDSPQALFYDEAGEYVYVVSDGANKYFSCIDVSDKANPSLTGSVQDNTKFAGCKQICQISTRYYAVSGSTYNGISIVDVNDPANPVIIGALQENTNLAGCYGVATDGTTLWATAPGNDSIQPIDISTIATPTIAATTALTDATKLASPRRLRYYDGYLYTVEYTNSYLFIAEVSTPFAPTEAYSETHADITNPTDIWVDGINRRAFVTAEADDQIVSYLIADPTSPTRSVAYTDAAKLDAPQTVYASGAVVFASVDGEDRIVAVLISGYPLPFPITSIAQFNSVDGTRHTLVTAGPAVYTVNLTSGEFTNITGTKTLPQNAEWHWTYYDGVAVGVNGGGTNVDNPVYWDGETAAIQTLSDAPATAQYIELFNHRAVASDGYTLYWSKLGDITDWSDPILSGAVEIDADYDGDITGLVAHKGFLIIFKENNVWRLLPGSPNTDTDQWSIERVISGHGCLNGSSARAILDDVLFLSKEGLLSLSTMLQVGDYESAQASDPIKELEGLRTDDRYPSVVDPVTSQYWISLPASLTPGDDNDLTFVMDFSEIAQKQGGNLRWTRFTGDIVGECYASGKDDDNDVVVFIGGYNDLFVRKKTTDTTPYQDDASGAIDYDFLSKETDFGLPFKRKVMNRFGMGILKLTTALTISYEIRFNGSGSASHTYTFDIGASVTGDDIEIIRKLIGAAGKNALSFQYRLRNNTANEAFGINALMFEVSGITHTRVDET